MRLGLASLCLVAASAGIAAASPKLFKGPYLQDLAPTSITVMWQMDEQVPGRLVVIGPGGERSQDVGAANIVEARVDGLQPSSRYRYRVEAAGQSWEGE